MRIDHGTTALDFGRTYGFHPERIARLLVLAIVWSEGTTPSARLALLQRWCDMWDSDLGLAETPGGRILSRADLSDNPLIGRMATRISTDSNQLLGDLLMGPA